MVSVAKFGGTSVGTAEKLMQVASIIKDVTPESRYITVSAPALGEKRMTKMLRQLTEHSLQNNGDVDKELFLEVSNWFMKIAKDVGQDMSLIGRESHYLLSMIKNPYDFNKDLDVNEKMCYSAVESFGERLNARCLASALNYLGMSALYLEPSEAGIFVDNNYGDARLLTGSYETIKNYLSNLEGYIVVPGYYGYTEEGHVSTFSRGGTDLTGAILAAALKADKYQIFKDDVEGVCSADPKIVPDAKTLEEITYKEMREMAYLGSQVVHQDVMKLCRDANVPLVVRNTNNISNNGTRIVKERDTKNMPVVGLAKKDGFVFFTIEQMGMNETVGYLNNVLGVFNEENVSIDHMTTSIDSISLSVHQSQLKENHLQICENLKEKLNPDWITLTYNQALICIVGEGMKQRIGTFSRISSALSRARINIKTVYQTPSEDNVIIGVNGRDSDNAVRALHKEFFGL